MGLVETILTWWVLMNAAFALPLESSDAASVSCFSSGPAASIDPLYNAMNHLCTASFPTGRPERQFTTTTTYGLAGTTATFTAQIDNTKEWVSADCTNYFVEVIAICMKASGKSPGGKLEPEGTTNSLFTVKVNGSPKVARSAADSADKPFNGTADTQSLFTTSCNNGPSSDNPTCGDGATAHTAADDFCSQMDGVIVEGGDQAGASYDMVDPSLGALAVATSDVLVTYSDCDWAYDTLFKACEWNGLFYGGLVDMGDISYSLAYPLNYHNAGLCSGSSPRALSASSDATDANITADVSILHSTSDDSPDTGIAFNGKRQGGTCIMAEATPIDKDLAMQAVNQFCPDYSSKFYDQGTGASGTYDVGDYQVTVTFSVNVEDGYMMYPQRCGPGFLNVVTQCSYDGGETTKGGTIGMEGSVSWSLFAIQI